jgi:hypothetical protein
MDKVAEMNLRQSFRRAAGAPARRFFDQRFNRVEHRVDELGQRATQDAARVRDDLVRELEGRLDRISFELAAATRGHLESMTYVAVELARIEAGLTGEIEALRAEVIAAVGNGRGLAVHAFALRALATVPSDGRILVRGPDTDLTARALIALGHAVSASAESNGDGPYAALVLSITGAAEGEPDVASAVELLAPGGLAVLAVEAEDATAPSGLEIIDRATAGDAGDGSWRIGGDAKGLTLLAARRS